MIKYFLFTYCLTVSLHLNSQSSNKTRERYKKYEFIIECPMRRCDIDGKYLDSQKLVAPVGSKFILVYQEKDMCIIRFLINTKKNRKRGYDFMNKEPESYKYFRINQYQLDFKSVDADFRNYNLTVGNVVTPIKLRMSPFNFSKDFTVGPTFGVRYQKHDYSKTTMAALIGMGISSVTLDSFNTDGKTRRNIEVLAFTPSIGFMLEFGNSQIGVFSGFDLLNKSNDVANFFIYNGSPWISIGFGYSLFSTKSNN